MTKQDIQNKIKSWDENQPNWRKSENAIEQFATQIHNQAIHDLQDKSELIKGIDNRYKAYVLAEKIESSKIKS